jgi:hypothetical protein
MARLYDSQRPDDSRKYRYQEGREASGERRTVWKGVRLVDKNREKDYDHTDCPAMQQSPKAV